MKPYFNAEDTKIKRLGKATIESPLHISYGISKNDQILFHPYPGIDQEGSPVTFEISQPEKLIYFDPTKVTAGIVTCGGLCPGLNNVIRAIVLGLYHAYKVRSIFGIRYGFQGFIPKYGHPLVKLTPEVVADIHEQGGTILGSSRGAQSIEEIVDSLERQNMNMLFIIGGDGTLNAAAKIAKEVSERNLKISVVAIPKTIDNDISCVSRSFGFETAVETATQAIQCAHTEAQSYPNGIGLVKLMGRYSGFIAATAAVAQRDVNFVLVPEVDFDLEGANGFLEVLRARLEQRSHAVIVVAEGAGQKFFDSLQVETDKSGNVKLKDIGVYLQKQIQEYFQKLHIETNLKYIDPSYIVRSVPANTNDGLFSAILGQNAVHAAMAGKSDLVVSIWHGVYCQLPIALAITERKKLHPSSRLWVNVLESTGQPTFKAG
ncbi:MAG: ATP-dependent 6-phosphofructokinase [Deltaproteobacteria bacterium]|jgi:6-phosphofructokinase 1|nr:ATP-dependent 6-phosphofructokinase [Deltaproteobacteria bacterium]MBT4091785.1 ATP-dependent 6-phosphofructokinase [Deltaproteobacteria bacterium]MBT4264842.1 ATP-dependent 6-phosphofructokinase [Deltaproteobacteria bacterium]MBT4640072.1 ATP-dependent 6-phosphofructokinase [Deltaproteobacteria bacterium]MBT7153155.1 ATP-dependent 6-phosphofructokinase [Deltaproteobacteria bacterium]